ncbi:c-di-GMP-binding flagellar brake protein YcgR [Hypnocyclicus thermotrophus]|uniref:C-di-GMP-binding flagellar brake protein YcgR n=1 Tax=Hypnocyclicus thermotrophus TaxID=1627895 RepID=A0AA46E0K0_9FUSO|nr:PilZ domain-containing protein [Hypnocyclicus thermotrophus]TDT72253.1 c-di-GMP-binding flagellar brake protein YcgR [Hypnocyclicus thermotrophus]
MQDIILKKDNYEYNGIIEKYDIKNHRITIKILAKNKRNIFLHKGDSIDIEISKAGYYCHFNTKIIYNDVIDHEIVVEYPETIFNDERRKYRRLTLRIEIDILKGNKNYKGLMENISLGGIAFMSSYNFDPSDIIYITFTLPNGVIYKNIKAEIKFKKTTDFPKIKEYGTKFIELSEGQKDVLNDFLY